MNIPKIAELLIREYAGASNKFPPFRSVHEGLGIIEEEFEELKHEIFKKKSERSIARMRKEASHLGAMAMRFIYDICEEH